MQTVKRAKARKSRKNRLNRELKRELGKKLVGYSAVAGAVLAIGAAGSEEASAVAIKVTNQWLTVSTGWVYLDIDGGGVDDMEFNVSHGSYISTGTAGNIWSWNTALAGGDSYSNPNARIHGSFWKDTWVSGTGTTAVANTDSGYDAIAIAGGAAIGAGLFGIFATSPVEGDTGGAPWGELAWNYLENGVLTTYYTDNPGGAFLSRGFLGVSFDIDGFTHYGWVDLEVDSFVQAITIRGWGYEDVAGASINAGEGQEAIPEPATLVTLAMGAAGLYAWRRGRRRKSVKNKITRNDK